MSKKDKLKRNHDEVTRSTAPLRPDFYDDPTEPPRPDDNWTWTPWAPKPREATLRHDPEPLAPGCWLLVWTPSVAGLPVAWPHPSPESAAAAKDRSDRGALAGWALANRKRAARDQKPLPKPRLAEVVLVEAS